MKAKRFQVLLAVSAAVLAADSSRAATVTKNNTYTMQANTTDWSAAPATTDIGSFTGTLDATHAAGLTLGGSLSIGSLLFNNSLAGPVTFGSGGTLTLNTAGTDIDMSAANQNVTINCAVALGAAQTWNVAAARTLTVAGAISGGFGLTEAGSGTVSLSGTGSTTTAISVNGGTLAVTGGDMTSSGSLTLNSSGTATTGLSVSGGTLTVKGSGFLTGQVTGTYNSTITQTGGAIVYINNTSLGSGQLSLANTSTTNTTTMTLSGGTLSCTDYWGPVLAQRGTTVATISGTAVATFAPGVYTGNPGLTLAGQSTAVCTLNLDGGTLVVGSIAKGNGSGTLYLNGGTLKSSRALTTFLTGLTDAKVKAGGAVIDDGGYAITIGQALLTDTVSLGGGLTKKGAGTLTLSTTPTYTGTTAINAGTLALGSGVALNSASNISLSAGATLDVTGLGASATYTLGGSAALSASGTGTTVGTTAAAIKGGATGTVSLGSRPVSLTWGGAAAGTDSTHPALTVSQGTLSLGGNQFTVVTGSALDVGVYTLVSAPAITGTVNAVPVVTGSGLSGSNVGVISISGNSVILTVSPPTATISATGSPLAALATTYGTASAETSFTVSGSGLSAGLTVTPPAGYEVSTTSGAGYVGGGVGITFGSPPAVASTTVYVRLAANAPVGGSYNSQNIALTSPAAITVNVATAATGNGVAAKALTVASATALGKLYDGNAATTVTGTLLASEAFGTGTGGDGKPYAGDTLTVGAPGTFASAAAGTGIAVSAGTFTLGGASAGNYTLAQPTGLSLSADILNTAVWTQAAGGSWPTTGNWLNNIIATGIDNTGDFSTLNLSAGPTVTLDGARTIGNLIFDDQNATKHAWTLNTGSAGPLTLAVNSGSPVVSANVATTIGAAIAGTQGLTKTGNGTLTLTGTNTYTGTTAINAGTLATSNFVTLGTGMISIGASGTYAFSTTASNQPAFTNTVSGSGTFAATGSAGNQSFWGGDWSGFTGTLTIGAADAWWARTSNTGNPAMRVNVSGLLSLYDSESGITRTYNIGELSGAAGSQIYGNPNTANVITVSVGALNTSSSYAGALWNNWNHNTTSTLGLTKVGSGTLTLTGVNGYTGVTTVTAGTLEIGGAGQLGSGSYAANITDNGALSYNSTANQTLGGIISGTGSLTKANSGTLSLAGACSYTGTTTVTAGTLAISTGGAITGSPTIDVQSAGTLQGGTFATGQTVQGTGALTGSISISPGGTLSPAGGGTIGTLSANGTLTLAGNTVMDINKSGTTLTSDAIGGTGVVAFGGTLTVNTSGDTLALGDTFTLFSNGGGRSGGFTSYVLPALPAGLNWDTSILAANGTITVVNFVGTPFFTPAAGNYVGAQSITITSDSGATIYYTLDGSDPSPASTHSASPVTGITVPTDSSMTVKAYAVKAGQADSPVATANYLTLTTPAWNVDANGNWSDASRWLFNVIPDGSGVPVDFHSFLQTGYATVTLDSSRTVGSMTFGNTNNYNWELAATSGSALTLSTGAGTPTVTVLDNTTTISAPLAGSQGLTKNGNGTLVLSGGNVYGGDTTVAAGILQLGAANVIPGGVGKGNLILTGTLDMGGFSDTVNGLSGTGTIDKTSSVASTLTVGGNDATSTFNGVIQNTAGALSFTKTGSGTLTLTNISTYSGNTLVSGGTLEVPGGASIGNASGGKMEVNGATLHIFGGSVTGNGNGNVFLANTTPATLNMSAGSLTFYAASQYWDVIVGNFAPATWNQTGGAVNLYIGELYVGNSAGSGGTAMNLSGGTFSVNGTAGTSKQAVLIAVRTNTSFNLSGSILATIPTLQYGHSPAVTTAGVTGTLNLDGGTLLLGTATNAGAGNAIFNFNGGLLSALADNTTFMTGLTTANVRNGGALIDSNSHAITIGQGLVHSTVGGDNATDGGLTKSGNGTLTLSGSCTYNGPTTVSAGTLEVDGSIASTTTTVAATGTLAGTGTVGGSITASGTIAPGISGIGTLNAGNTTLTGIYSCQIDGATSDKLAVTGNLDLNGATIHLSEVNPATANSYVIATYTGTLATLVTPPAITGLGGYALDTATAGQVKLVKSGYALWAAGFPGLTDTTPAGDPDHDGIPNLMEYVIGGDPRAASTAFLPDHTTSGGNLIFHYKRNDDSKTDTTQVVEWSADMATWTQIPIPAATSGVVTVTENGSAPDDISVAIPLSNAVNGKLFARLRVTKP